MHLLGNTWAYLSAIFGRTCAQNAVNDQCHQNTPGESLKRSFTTPYLPRYLENNPCRCHSSSPVAIDCASCPQGLSPCSGSSSEHSLHPIQHAPFRILTNSDSSTATLYTSWQVDIANFTSHCLVTQGQTCLFHL